MSAAPFRRGALPAVGAPAAAATREAARRLSGGAFTRTIDFPGLGPATVSLAGIGSAGSADPGAAVFELARGGNSGRLSIDGTLALRLVSAALGSPRPRMLRPLGSAERGVLAAQVVTALGQLDARATVRLDPPRAPAGSDWVELDIDVAVEGVTAPVRLDVPVTWVPVCAPASDPWASAAPASLAVTAIVELAATRVPLGDLAAAGPGDAVVFDGVPFPPPEQAALRIGRHVARCRLRPDGSLLVETPFTEEMPMAPSRRAEPASVTEVLAAAPVDVAIELARVTMRGDEVLGLGPGAVVPLGKTSTSPVDLLVGGRSFARGELVDVDGELGVRLIELTGGGASPVGR